MSPILVHSFGTGYHEFGGNCPDHKGPKIKTPPERSAERDRSGLSAKEKQNFSSPELVAAQSPCISRTIACRITAILITLVMADSAMLQRNDFQFVRVS
jgi:hypothetical protein